MAFFLGEASAPGAMGTGFGGGEIGDTETLAELVDGAGQLAGVFAGTGKLAAGGFGEGGIAPGSGGDFTQAAFTGAVGLVGGGGRMQ